MADLMVAPESKRVKTVDTRIRVRKWLGLIHIWLGLPIGLLLCLFTATGSIIVFRAEIERAFEPKVTACATPAIDLGAAMQQVSAYASGAAVTQISMPSSPGQPYQFSARGATRVLYDGCAGNVVGTLKVAWLDWLANLHQNLLAGKAGRGFTGIFGHHSADARLERTHDLAALESELTHGVRGESEGAREAIHVGTPPQRRPGRVGLPVDFFGDWDIACVPGHNPPGGRLADWRCPTRSQDGTRLAQEEGSKRRARPVATVG